MSGENWVLITAILAWLLVTLTRLALAHRRAVKGIGRRRPAAPKETPNA